jgi:hypothetical protein
MTRFIQQITQQLLDRLPDNDQYYRLDEMRSWGFPSYIVMRIKIELERNLAESMIPPKTDWANTKSDTVQFAWQKFVDAIRAEARLPASYAKTVIETAVADVMEMLIQPRKNIPAVIFGTDKKLSYDEIEDRTKAVVVYRHFATLVPRFMQKKDLKKLSKKRCTELIAETDEKITDQYSPLNWAQMLEPLFSLLDDEIDTDLLRLFFEDKEMPRVARKFDLLDDTVTRAEFIEILSSPDLIDFEGDDQSTLFDDQQESVPAEEEKSEKEELKENSGDKATEPPTESEMAPSVEETPVVDQSSYDDLFPDKEEISSLLFPDEKSEGTSKQSKLEKEKNEGTPGDKDLNNQPENAGGNSLNAIFVEKGQEKQKDEPPKITTGDKKDRERDFEEDNAETDANESIEEGERSKKLSSFSDEKETPMWMRFMSEEEIEEYKKQELEGSEVEESEAEEDEFIDDPIIDLTNEEASDEEIQDLFDLLSDDRELFVDEIFRGSDRAFDEAIEDIATYENWRNASKYIQKDIFKRNLVDMYSEEAVDFTDRLQTYFLEKQKSK